MSQIFIGKTESGRAILPHDVVTSTIVCYGGKGMGKTNFGSVLVEELSKAKLRWSYLDPLGVAWGLRHSSDGKGPGVECVILGGAHGDIPIEPTGGAVVADLVVDEESSVIIDFSRKPSGEMWTIGEKVRFLTEYTKRVFQRQGSLLNGHRREPFFQILDEAARYVPQVIPHGNPQLAECLSAWETLVEEGRNVGIGVGLLTQRSARMAKSVSEVADAMFSFRIVGPNSIGAVMDWLGEHVAKDRIKTLVETLRSLDRGRCLLVSPGWLRFEDVVSIRARETFDSSATPKPGERPRRVTGEGAKPDLAKYSERMKETIERAKDNDPAELKRQVRELKAKLAKPARASAFPASNAVAKPEETAKAFQKRLDALRRIADRLFATTRFVARQASEEALKAIPALKEFDLDYSNLIGNLTKVSAAAIQPKERGEKTHPIAKPRPITPPETSSNGHHELTGPMRKILRALAEFEAIGKSGPIPRSMVASWCGVKSSTGTFKNYLSELRTHGLIVDARSGDIELTDAGREASPHVDAPATTEQLLERAASIFGGTASKILRLIHEAYPAEVTREFIGERLEISSDTGTFKNYLSELRTTGLITDGRNKTLRAADWLFL